MRSVILGGNGRTGRLVIDEALERGHHITALVRNPSSLKPRANLTIVEGTPLEFSDVERAIRAHPEDPPGAIIITLNARGVSHNFWSANTSPLRLMASSSAHAVALARKWNIRKLVIMSAFGVADSWPYLHFLRRAAVTFSNMRHQWEYHRLVDKQVKSSGLDWVLVRPVKLKDGEKKPVIMLGDLGDRGVGLMSSVTRESVAWFIVDAVEKRGWNCSTPVIMN